MEALVCTTVLNLAVVVAAEQQKQVVVLLQGLSVQVKVEMAQHLQ
jgi:hypothetical protein